MIEYKFADTNLMMSRLELGDYGTNCYVVADKTAKECIVIDPGGDFEILEKYLSTLDVEVKYIFNTHGHWDHIGANAQLQAATNAPLYIHEADGDMLLQSRNAMGGKMNPSKADAFYGDGDEFKMGKYTWKVLATPGHTRGGVSLLLDDLLVVTGDTLFQYSVGRTDLPGGSMDVLVNSIKTKLFVLPEDMPALPGHGPHTFIGEEKMHNPFVK